MEYLIWRGIPIISSLAFYLVPFIIGKGLTSLTKRERPASLEQKILYFFANFSVGGLVIYAQILFAHFTGITKIFPLSKVIIFIIGCDVLLSTITILYSHIKLQKSQKGNTKERVNNLLLILFFVFVTIIIFSLWTLNSPSSATLNWDIYHHQTLINLIKKDQFRLLSSKMSDSFQFTGYLTIFHTLGAIPQIIFNPNILDFWYFAQYFHLLSVALISYLFAYAVTKKRLPALIAAILGTLVFESSMAYTSLFLMPQNLAAVITGAFLAKIILEYPRTTKQLVTDFLVFAAFILPMHLIVGSLGTFLFIFTTGFLYLEKIKEDRKIQNILLAASFISIPVIFFLATKVDLSGLNRGEAAHYTYNLAKKVEMMRDFYGYGLLAFLPLGYFYALKKGQTKYTLLMILNNGIMSLIIASIPYTLKLQSVGRLTTHTLMALGVWMLIKPLPKIAQYVAIVFLTITFGAVFIINAHMFKGVPDYRNLSTHISPVEIKAAEFLKENYSGKPVLIVSEPATMHILEGLSGVNSPGGAYASTETREILTEIYIRRDENIKKKLFKIRDGLEGEKYEKILFVISGRFKEWQLAPNEDRYGIHWNVWRPQDLEPRDFEKYGFIYYLEEFAEFRRVFRNSGVVIFEVDREYF